MPSVPASLPLSPGSAAKNNPAAAPPPPAEALFHGRTVSIRNAGESKASNSTIATAADISPHDAIPPLTDRKAAIGSSATSQRPVDFSLASDAIPTSTAIKTAYGEPKADVVRMGVTLKKNSTAYRQVLAQLDIYHKACTLGKREPKFLENADAMLTALQGLQKALAIYVSDARRSRVNDLQELLVTVTNEITRISTLPGQLAQFRKDAPSLASIPDAELAHLLSAGVFTAATLVPASVAELGKGAISTVLQADYIIDGRRMRMVFKPETPGISLGHAAEEAGIPVADPNMTGRSVATHVYARLLSLDLVPLTVPAVLDQVAGCLRSASTGINPS